jgi:hypothetical protein
MTRWIIVAAAFFTSAIPAGASPRRPLTLQDSAASSTSSQSAPQESPAIAPSPAEPKKTKKVWTNENLDDVSASPISLIGDPKQKPSAKAAVGKPASPADVANFRKQLATLQTQLVSVEKEIADLKAFVKGEAPGAIGLQVGKRYSTEPIPDQLRKLDEKKKSLAA